MKKLNICQHWIKEQDIVIFIVMCSIHLFVYNTFVLELDTLCSYLYTFSTLIAIISSVVCVNAVDVYFSWTIFSQLNSFYSLLKILGMATFWFFSTLNTPRFQKCWVGSSQNELSVTKIETRCNVMLCTL